jgi:hypothetical protein
VELALVGTRPLADAALISPGGPQDSLVIDATHLTFACPLDLAGMVATAHWAAAECSLPVVLKMPNDPNSASYLQRMDVLRHMPSRTLILGHVPPEGRGDHRGTLLEVTALNHRNADDLAEVLGPLVESFYAGHSDGAANAVFLACGELLSNAVEHGDSATGAFIAAQTYTGNTTEGQRFEFAICDTGIGVMQHLRRNPRHSYLTRDELAIKEAMKAGVSGVGSDRGNGLSDVIERTRAHGVVSFQIRSGRGEVRVAGTPESHTEVPKDRPDQTSGTWAWLSHRIPVQ